MVKLNMSFLIKSVVPVICIMFCSFTDQNGHEINEGLIVHGGHGGGHGGHHHGNHHQGHHHNGNHHHGHHHHGNHHHHGDWHGGWNGGDWNGSGWNGGVYTEPSVYYQTPATSNQKPVNYYYTQPAQQVNTKPSNNQSGTRVRETTVPANSK